VLASVGSLIQRKGHDITIRALAALRGRGVDAHLVVCGDGEAEGDLRALAASLGVGDRTHLLGMRRDVGAVLRTLADVYVSAAHDEALPLNVLEAQFLGCAVVASDIAAHHEAIVPGGTGLLFRDGDADDLAAQLARLAAAPDERRRFGAAGHARAADEFLVERYQREFYALYDELVAAPASRFGWVGGSSWPATYTDWAGTLARRVLPAGRRG
jgi:glycosyltransferase involved in cell wall biosynthesis